MAFDNNPTPESGLVIPGRTYAVQVREGINSAENAATANAAAIASMQVSVTEIQQSVNTAQANLDTHSSQSEVHNATSAATAGRLILRDGAGRAQIATPSDNADIANKQYVDNVTNGINTDVGDIKAELETQIEAIGSAAASAQTVAAGAQSTASNALEAAQNAVAPYDSNRTYSLNDFVTYEGGLYLSLQDDNAGNTPAEATAYWGFIPNVSDWIERRPQSMPKITSFLQGLMDRTVGVGVYSYNNIDAEDLSDIIPGSDSGLIIIHKRNDDIGNTPATYGNWSVECHSANGIIYTKWVDIAVGESSWREVWSEKLPYSTLTSNGWYKLPNGLILQWGYGSMTGTKSFPVAFPNAVLVAVASNYQGNTAVGINADTNSTFIIYSTADAIAYKYIAIGY